MTDLMLYKRNYYHHLLRIISNLYILISVIGYAERSIGCIVEERHLSPYVTASYERYPPLSGCFSREITAKSKEQVHAVVLTQRDQGLAETPEQVVNIFLKPSSQDAYDGSSQIFLLFSTEPVTWRVHPPRRLANTFIGKFWISNSSHIERSGGDRIRMKVRKQRRMHSNDDPTELIDWMREKWGAVTSFLQLEMANLITIEAGIDSTADDRCRFHMVLPNNMASLLELRDTKGCTSYVDQSQQISDRDVHIVELLRASHTWQSASSSGSKRGELTEVVVNVRPRARRPVLTKHLVLVLKSHVPVTWTVTTQSLRGTLDVITDDIVNSSLVGTHTLRIAAESLAPYTGQSLLQWTSEKYGQPLSYTVAPLANHFDIIVDGADGQANSASSRQNSPDNGKTGNADREDVSRDTDQKPPAVEIEPKSREQNPSSPANGLPANQVKMGVILATRIYCSSDEGSVLRGSDSGFMQISIAKELLKSKELGKSLGGLHESDISLKDRNCGATDNGTHYLLFTRLNGCLTTLINPMESGDTGKSQDVVYQNTIRIRYSGGDTTSIRQLTINVRCDLRGELPIRTHPVDKSQDDKMGVGSAASTAGAAQFQLRLYRDSGFREEITAYPQVISEEQHLFVKAEIISNETNLRVVVTDCSLESEVVQESGSTAMHRSLISRRCTVDKGVKWIDDLVTSREGGGRARAEEVGGVRGERFMVRMRCETCGPLVELRCQLLLCSNSIAVQQLMKVSECPLRGNSCSGASAEQLQQLQARDWSIAANITRGPLLIQSSQSPWPLQNSPLTNLTSISGEGNTAVDTDRAVRKNAESSGQKSSEDAGGERKPPTSVASALEDDEEEERCEQVVNVVVGLDSVAVVGIAFASFLIGVALVAAIWFIYVKTARRVVKGKGGITVVGGVVAGALSGGGRISADSSGDSTPCSTAPMTVKHSVHT